MPNRILPSTILSIAVAALFGYACLISMKDLVFGFSLGWVAWLFYACSRIALSVHLFLKRNPLTSHYMARFSLGFTAVLASAYAYGRHFGDQHIPFLVVNALMAANFALSISAGTKFALPEPKDGAAPDDTTPPMP